MVIQNDSDLNTRSIEVIELLKKLNELRTSMSVLDIPMDMARKETDGSQKGNDTMPLIFIVPSDGRMLPRDRRKLRGIFWIAWIPGFPS
jgi:hypothetical protein